MKHVLVVEDDPEQQKLLADVLREAGFLILASDEGRKALELAPLVPPCAVVLDLAMHGMDGREFLRRRRDVPVLASVPVVVVTGSPAEGLDADAVLVKPLDVQALLSAFRRLGVSP
jgi:CheY-like chemotaxis protein